MPVASVAERVKIHEESAWRILAYHVNEAIERFDLSQLDTIGVDEISVKKGHKYITLFYDIKNAKVIHIEVGKGKDTIKSLNIQFLRRLTPNRLNISLWICLRHL